MQDRIQEAAYQFQMDIESGARTVVGVNAHVEEGHTEPLRQPDYSALEGDQVGRVREVREGRDDARARAALERVRLASRSSENLLPPMIEAVKADATLGEISDTLRTAWGTYRPG
jgi:methylmalonyl-CoA mutase N-terminal domain/subunit